VQAEHSFGERRRKAERVKQLYRSTHSNTRTRARMRSLPLVRSLSPSLSLSLT
jgi:hypothetical protein